MGALNFGRIYAGKWSVASSTKLSAQESANFNSCKVVNSEYGLSACFFMKSGGQGYIPLSQESNLVEGDEIKLDSIKVLTLVKDGESPIQRIDGEAV